MRLCEHVQFPEDGKCLQCQLDKPCRRCGHGLSVHTGECPCAPGKKICESPTLCLCREYKEYFKGENIIMKSCPNCLGEGKVKITE